MLCRAQTGIAELREPQIPWIIPQTSPGIHLGAQWPRCSSQVDFPVGLGDLLVLGFVLGRSLVPAESSSAGTGGHEAELSLLSLHSQGHKPFQEHQ